MIEIKFPNGTLELNHLTVLSAELSHAHELNLYNIRIKLNDQASQHLRKLRGESVGKDAHLLRNGQIIKTATVMSLLGSHFLLKRLSRG
ncbi:MAG TPA: hypothetical protein PLD88_13795 [Candidatus Berkiella sp.]|nr:hypothetical protein [Candidatus Berkiella sp.]